MNFSGICFLQSIPNTLENSLHRTIAISCD